MILMNNDGYDGSLGYKMFDVLLFFLPEPTMSPHIHATFGGFLVICQVFAILLQI